MPNSPDLDASPFAPHLQPHECIVWTGRPRQGLAWRREDNAKAPFSALWLAFVLCWLWVARSMGAGPIMIGPGIAFAIVGAYFLVGRFFADAIARTRMRYAVTDRRALILSGKRLTAIEFSSIGQLQFLPERTGRGSIVFGPLAKGIFGSYEEALKPSASEFFQTRDAESAYSLLVRGRDEA